MFQHISTSPLYEKLTVADHFVVVPPRNTLYSQSAYRYLKKFNSGESKVIKANETGLELLARVQSITVARLLLLG